jgi:hypothetical protein
MTQISEQPVPLEDDISDTELEMLAAEASRDAIADSLARGVSVHYLEDGVMVREDPDGKRFEIEFIAPDSDTTRVIRELTQHA